MQKGRGGKKLGQGAEEHIGTAYTLHAYNLRS